MADKLVSISGSFTSGSGNGDQDRLVGAAIVRPALVSGGNINMTSALNAHLKESTYSSSYTTKTYDADDARLDALLEPEYVRFGRNKPKSLKGCQPSLHRSKSSETLELLLADDFDEKQKRVEIATDLRSNGKSNEKGRGDNNAIETSSESLESVSGSEHKRSCNNVVSCGSKVKAKETAILKNYRESKEATNAKKFEDPASDSSESDDEFYRKLRAPMKQHHQNQEKVHPNYAGHTVQNEITVPDLPEIEEIKDLNLEDDAYMEVIGHVMSVVGVLAVIKSANESMALNEESVLFKEDKTVFGKVFEVFGPVKDPFYSVRFNNAEEIKEKGIKVGLPVFCCLSDFELTKVVFKTDLDNLKGSDASWLNDCEPPPPLLEYSDDEAEREARRKLQLERRARRENENVDLQDDVDAPMDSPDDSNDDEETKAAKLERKLMRERQKHKESKTKKANNDDASGAKSVRTNAMGFNQSSSDRDEISSRRGEGGGGGRRGRRGRGGQKSSEPIDVLYMKQLQKDAPQNSKVVSSQGFTSSQRGGRNQVRGTFESNNKQNQWQSETDSTRMSLSNPFDLEMRRGNRDLLYRPDEFHFSRPFPEVPLNLTSDARHDRPLDMGSEPSPNSGHRTLGGFHAGLSSRNYTMPVAPSNSNGGFKPATFNYRPTFDSFSSRSSVSSSGDSLFRFQSGHRTSPGMPVAPRSVFSPGRQGNSRFIFSGTDDRHESWIGLGTSQNHR